MTIETLASMLAETTKTYEQIIETALEYGMCGEDAEMVATIATDMREGDC